MSGKLFIISAPSGAGKTTLVTEVINSLKRTYTIERLVTYTTKPVREGECPGVDYHYIDTIDFQHKIKQGYFIEYSTAYQYYYGTPYSVIEKIKNGVHVVLIIDRVGAQKIIEHFPDGVLIWIYPKNIDVLAQRLSSRGRDSVATISYRLKKAQEEMTQENSQPFYTYHILNDLFQDAVSELIAVFTKEIGFFL